MTTLPRTPPTSGTSPSLSSQAPSTAKASSTTLPSSGHYSKHAVDRRDRRHKDLQCKLKQVKRSLHNTTQQVQAHEVTIANMQSGLGETSKKMESAKETLAELQVLCSTLIEENHTLSVDNGQLQSMITDLERDLTDYERTIHTETKDFTIQTKDGTRYLNSVRELYYNLLTTGIPPEKINGTIHLVIAKLCPSLDISNLKLPKKSCANYMRMAEMPTVSDVHKI